MISRRQVIAGATTAPLILRATASGAGVSPPTIDEFLKPELDRDVALSPNGRQIAILTARTDGEHTVASVTIMDADHPEKTAVIPIGDLDVEQIS